MPETDDAGANFSILVPAISPTLSPSDALTRDYYPLKHATISRVDDAYAPTLLRARWRDWSVIASRVVSFKAKVSDSA